MANVRVTYDAQANAAYIYLTEPEADPRSARTYCCDPGEVDGMINLDFDPDGRVIGVEVLDARSKLPPYLLEEAERIDQVVQPSQGDVFFIPVVDDSVAVGRVVAHVDGSVLIAVYPDLVDVGVEFDVELLSGRQHVFLLETLDDALKDGTWETVGNWIPPHEIDVPVHKVRVWPDGDFFEQTMGGVVGRRLTDEEAEAMSPPRSHSPNIVALAVRALHGLGPWLPAFDDIRADRDQPGG